MPRALSKVVRDEVVGYARTQARAYAAAQEFLAWAEENETAIGDWPRNPDGTLVGLNVTISELIDLREHARAVVAAGDEHTEARALVVRALEVYG
jgi:hypothetical protein